MTLMPLVFPKLRTAKNESRQMSKRLPFRTPFDSQHVKWSQAFGKSARQHFYRLSSLLFVLSWEISLLV